MNNFISKIKSLEDFSISFKNGKKDISINVYKNSQGLYSLDEYNSFLVNFTIDKKSLLKDELKISKIWIEVFDNVTWGNEEFEKFIPQETSGIKIKRLEDHDIFISITNQKWIREILGKGDNFPFVDFSKKEIISILKNRISSENK